MLLALLAGLTLTAGLGAAQGAETPEAETIRPAGEATLEDFLWIKRPLVVFADNPADPRFVQQMQLVTDRLDALVDRDVVVITDTDPSARSPIRRALRPNGFMLALIAKDGTIRPRLPSSSPTARSCSASRHLGTCGKSRARSTSSRCASRRCATG